MKIKLSLLVIFLLAISGSASAQLVLQICTAQIPCPGFPLGSVQAGVDQNGWRNFKVTLTQNVTLFSILGTPPPSQASVNVIFTQDGIGGRTVTFAANITNACTITATANATTLCQFEFDGTVGIWIGISGGGAASLPTGATGSVLASQGVGIPSALQTKPIFDVRDFMTCDGVTNATGGMGSLINSIGSNSATVNVTGPCNVALVQQPTNVTMDFSAGGSIKLIPNATSPGGGAFVQGSGQSNAAASPTSSCAATLTSTTAGNTIVMMVSLYNTFGPDNARISSVIDGKDLYVQQMQTTLGQAAYLAVYAASSIQGGTVTVTANFSHSEKNACQAWEISGMGPVIGTDASTFAYGSTTPFAAGPVTLAAGDFVIAVSEDPNDPQTCTAGAGYTQPAGAAGNVGTASTSGVAQCAEYIANGTGGSTSATQNFSSSPVLSSWGSVLIGLKPGIATWSALGGINDPDLHQICINCTGTSGILNLTGNLAVQSVFPEWWGATGGPVQSAATNTPAMQAAIIGAFGTNRVNGSGANIWNKQLVLTGNYQINAELKFYHIIGNSQSRWNVWCKPGGGITQIVSNLRILDGQSDAYGRFDNCAWIGTASSTAPLIDLDFSGAQGADLAPQFIDFYSNSFNGSGTVDTGVLIAKTGGSAQGSNIYCYDCAGVGFTGAVWQVGGNNIGRNVGRFYAQNALAIGWYGGDMQNCPLYGLASYGGGYIDLHGTTFECVSPWASFLTSVATSVDFYCEGAQGPCSMDHVRSEDLRLLNGTSPRLNDTTNTDQSTAFYSPVNCIAGASEPLNWFIHGSDLGSDGALYQVTVHGTAFGGNCLFHASSGTATTIVDTNQNVPGALTIGLPVVGETMTQATSGSTGTLIVVPASTGTITGSVTSGTIVVGDTVTQATTAVHCIVVTPAPTGSGNLLVNQCSGTADNTHVWTDGGSGGTYTPTTAPVFSAASPQLLITAATGAPDGTHNWTGGTSGAVYVPSGVPVNEVNFPAFPTTVGAQSQVTFWGGTGIAQVCSPITTNTATSITFTTCTSNYYNIHPANADTTTTAIVEPCWQCGNVTTSGNFTFAKVNPEIIGGGNDLSSNISANCKIQDTSASAGLILCGGNTGRLTSIRGLQVTRADWYGITSPPPGGNVSDVIIPQLLQQVQVIRPFSTVAGAGLNWSIAGRNSNTNVFTGPLQTQQGTSPLVFSQSKVGGGTSANDTWIGTRSDPAAGTDTFRNRVEYSGMLGAGAPTSFNLTNQAGIATQIGGGPSTGSGTPGNIEFWLGSTGSSGSTVNSGLRMWFMDSGGTIHNDTTNNTTKGIAVGTGTSGAPAVALGGAVDGFYQFGTHQVGMVSNGFVAGNFNGSDGMNLNNADFLGWCGTGGGGTCLDGAVTLSVPSNAAIGANSILQVGSGAANATTGKVKAAGYMSGGTTFTSNAGCTESALTGGATAGKFTVGQATACTTIITMGNTATAPNGWTCTAYDQTAAPAVAIRQSATSTTTCSLSMTVATSDVIVFSAIGW